MKITFLKNAPIALVALLACACDSDSPTSAANSNGSGELLISSSSVGSNSMSSATIKTSSSSQKMSSSTEKKPNISSSSAISAKNSSSSVECMREVNSHVVVAKLSEYIVPGESCKENIIVFAKEEMLLATCKNNAWDTTIVVPCTDSSNKGSSSSNKNDSFSFADSSYSWQFGNPEVKYGTMVDSRNNHVYRTVTLGSQIWMAENLNFGDKKTVVYYDDYSCYRGQYENWEIDYACDLTGGYYPWYAAMAVSIDYERKIPEEGVIKTPHQGICPSGWHIPTMAEWKSLFAYVDANNGDDSVSTSLKSKNISYTEGDYEAKNFAEQFDWRGDNVFVGKDSFGFGAIPNGYMVGDRAKDGSDNGYYKRTTEASFWVINENASNAQTWVDAVTFVSNSESVKYDLVKKSSRRSVRCVKD